VVVLGSPRDSYGQVHPSDSLTAFLSVAAPATKSIIDAAHSSALDDAWPCRTGERRRVQSKYNWVWALVALLVWASIFFAFILIAIPRH
jgi:hypothetical protein